MGKLRRARRELSAEARMEAARIAADEAALLSQAWTAFNEHVGGGIDTLPVVAARYWEPTEASVRPATRQPERLVIQNWKSRPGLVPIGDVAVELEPGQEVTLWVTRDAALALQPGLNDDEPLDGLSILTEDDALLA